jgi:hypothetical protein
MRIGLITTLNTNIGDDLIRQGIILIFREIFKNDKLEFVLINKHYPMTVYPTWHPVHWTKIVPHFGARRSVSKYLNKVLYNFGFSLFDDCDVIIQSGAPVFWDGSHSAEWADILWRHTLGRLHKDVVILNLAAGSCYPWEKKAGIKISDKDEEYFKTILGYSKLTTVRDVIAKTICKSLDYNVPYLPCTAFLNGQRCDRDISLSDDKMILINYMYGGGHYDWGQGINKISWKDNVINFIKNIRKRHKVGFLCHNKNEYELAYHIDSSVPRFYPKNPKEYTEIVSIAKVALCNRMHASVVLASYGIPSIAVGTDTRLLMVKALGLPCIYVKDANNEILENTIEDILTNRNNEKERLLFLRSNTWNNYKKEISDVLRNYGVLR